jgi:16S rRNA (cytidine1402-2'-O)-methyltransferase
VRDGLPSREIIVASSVHPLPAIIAQAAAAAVGDQTYPGALYVVATPIGNLGDLSLRAVHVLGIVDAVACEDTRVSGGLLAHLGLHKPLIALHAHNEREASVTVVDRLARGQRVAYVSDAGTPAVSDPGARLVDAVRSSGHRVIPIPGASSAMAALCVAGDARAAGFSFVGFLPVRPAERLAAIQSLAQRRSESVVLFESPHRIAALLEAMAKAIPERRLTVARELTKQFEEVATLAAGVAPDWLEADAHRRRGEFVLVVHADDAARLPAATIDAATRRTLTLLLAELPLKRAVALASSITGAARNALYDLALNLRDADGLAE